MAREVVVISGKGGTGKTSLTASFAGLARGAVIVDCDVDASDLHLILEPEIMDRHDFIGGLTAAIDPAACISCGRCLDLCRFDAISADFRVSSLDCEGCGVCFDNCPAYAVTFHEKKAGEWYLSRTRFGPMVHATLCIAEENSGKLVSELKKKAREIAMEKGLDLILVDGSPGIGCPVISSLSGAYCALVVTEPTISGFHDMERILALTEHFRIITCVVVNKFDINPGYAGKIEEYCRVKSTPVLGRLPYDNTVTEAMVQKKTVIELNESPVAMGIREIWRKLGEFMREQGRR